MKRNAIGSRHRSWCSACILAAACGVLSPGAVRATTLLPDPAGDVFFFTGALPPGSPVPPDVVAVSAGFTSSELRLTVAFAAGTLQPEESGLFFVMALDTDLDDSTGSSFIPGADKLLLFATGLGTVNVCDELVPVPFCSATLPVTVEEDSLSLVVPTGPPVLADGGEVRFGFVAGLFIDGLPAAEDDAFDAVASSLEKTLSALSSPLAPRAVPILIKPGSAQSPINPMSRGVIPVAILGSAVFDVADIDVTSLAFGPEAAAPAHRRCGHLEDVNQDGFTDLLAHFRTGETGLAFGQTEACLAGELVNGTPFEGCDGVRVLVACGLGFELALLLPPLVWLHRRRRT